MIKYEYGSQSTVGVVIDRDGTVRRPGVCLFGLVVPTVGAGAKTGHSLCLNKHQCDTGNCDVHNAKQHGNTEYLLQRQAVFWVGSS
jgi:hypothetical protein